MKAITTWFEDGVYQVIMQSGGLFITRPGDARLPQVGASLELRVYSKTRNDMPMGRCYCEAGTDACVEEYSYP